MIMFRQGHGGMPQRCASGKVVRALSAEDCEPSKQPSRTSSLPGTSCAACVEPRSPMTSAAAAGEAPRVAALSPTE